MSIYEHLFNWQKDLVNNIKDKHEYGLWLKMGLGKTVIASGLAEVNNCTKVLIVAPNSKVDETIENEGSWLYWLDKSAIKYTIKQKRETEFDNNKAELFMLNYEYLYSRSKDKRCRMLLRQSVSDFVESCRGHNVAVICDESHHLNSLQTQQTLAITEILKRLRRISNCYLYLCTGTPFTTGYINLYSQLKLLNCKMTKTEFIDRFCVKDNRPGLLGWQQPIVDYKNTDEMFELVHQYATTIETEAVNPNMPELLIFDMSLPESDMFKWYSKSRLKRSEIERACEVLDVKYELPDTKDKYLVNPFFRNIDYPRLDWLAETTGTNWLRARQLSIGFQGNRDDAKWFDRRRLDMLSTILKTQPDNYIIFYNYVPELIELYQICEDLDYNIDCYCGDIKSLTFYNIYAKQSKDKQFSNKNNVILANYASASEGKNWQAYHNCILFSLPLYSEYEQSITRTHRTGQKSNFVICYRFYQKNYLDISMKEAIETKKQYSSDMFKQELDIQKEVNDDD